MEQILSLTRVSVAIAFLSYASWSDFKTREVSNGVWVIFAPVAFLLTFAQFLFFPPFGDVLRSMFFYAVSFGVVFLFSLALFYIGAFGGADAKALMCLALAVPDPSAAEGLTALGTPIFHMSFPLSGFTSPIFPITVFSNSVIIAALSVFYAILRNLAWKQRTGRNLFDEYENGSLGRKVLAMLCGYKVEVGDLEGSFLYPLEDMKVKPSGETARQLLLFPKDESREEIVARLVKAEEEEAIQTVWATPGLPMLIFITIGLVLALTVGDIVWIVLGRVLM